MYVVVVVTCPLYHFTESRQQIHYVVVIVDYVSVVNFLLMIYYESHGVPDGHDMHVLHKYLLCS